MTLTVTEAAYARAGDGGLDLDREDVRADVEALRGGGESSTVPGRLAAGLAARRAAGGGPLAVVPCDNLPGNGAAAAARRHGLAEAADPALADWIRDHVSFVTTMVDRITPRTTEDDVARGGRADGLARPGARGHRALHRVGAQRLLPGRAPRVGDGRRRASSTTSIPTRRASCSCSTAGTPCSPMPGGARGHETVAEAVADPACRRLARPVVGRGVGARAAARVRPGRLSRRAARAFRQSPDPAHARADRRRRLPEAADPGAARAARRARRRADAARGGADPRRPGSTTCAGSARRSRTPVPLRTRNGRGRCGTCSRCSRPTWPTTPSSSRP